MQLSRQLSGGWFSGAGPTSPKSVLAELTQIREQKSTSSSTVSGVPANSEEATKDELVKKRDISSWLAEVILHVLVLKEKAASLSWLFHC